MTAPDEVEALLERIKNGSEADEYSLADVYLLLAHIEELEARLSGNGPRPGEEVA